MGGLSAGAVLVTLAGTLLGTLGDVAPIAIILLGFQVVVLRRPIPHLRQVLIGCVYVVIGLALFLVGLEQALFPLGRVMALQLTDAVTANIGAGGVVDWRDYGVVYAFAFAIGLATTIAEPSLIAVADKAREVSGGAISAWGLRLAVALGVALAIAVGAFRIVTGTPLWVYMMVGYGVVIAQTMVAPKSIVPLAYDSGGVTTSTVTVPLVAALGLGLASTVPGRSVLLDGFGLIALASLLPMITVMAYAQLGAYMTARRARRDEETVE